MPKIPKLSDGVLRWTTIPQMYPPFRCWCRSRPIQSRRLVEFLLSHEPPMHSSPLQAIDKNARSYLPTGQPIVLSILHDRPTWKCSAVPCPLHSLLQGLGSTAGSLLLESPRWQGYPTGLLQLRLHGYGWNK